MDPKYSARENSSEKVLNSKAPTIFCAHSSEAPRIFKENLIALDITFIYLVSVTENVNLTNDHLEFKVRLDYTGDMMM